MPSLYRLFTAYGIECFCLFDADESKCSNKELSGLLNIGRMVLGTASCEVEQRYAYFSKDFETTAKNEIPDYSTLEHTANLSYRISGKPAIARFIAEMSNTVPLFAKRLANALDNATVTPHSVSKTLNQDAIYIEDDFDTPF